MYRGQQLAVEEINAAGGVAGYQIELVKLDTQAQTPDVMKTVAQNLVSQNVAAVMMPFFPTRRGVPDPGRRIEDPMFHVNTWHGNTDYVAAKGVHQHLRR